MKKFRFDIEIENSSKISGGYLTTTKPMTIKQVENFMIKLGKELIRNLKGLTSVSYWAWEDTEDVNPAHTWVSIYKFGRKFDIMTNSKIQSERNNKKLQSA